MCQNSLLSLNLEPVVKVKFWASFSPYMGEQSKLGAFKSVGMWRFSGAVTHYPAPNPPSPPSLLRHYWSATGWKFTGRRGNPQKSFFFLRTNLAQKRGKNNKTTSSARGVCLRVYNTCIYVYIYVYVCVL